jgi:predicted Zn-dependent protease
MALVCIKLWSLLLPSPYLPDSHLRRAASNPQPPARPRKSLGPVNWYVRYLVHRLSFFVLILASFSLALPGLAQESSSSLPQQPVSTPTATGPVEPQPPAVEVLAAEASISKSDWKAAESKLALWLTANPTDARALFDAGYVADTQNRPDEAAAYYRRAVAADANSFEAHLSLGLLLARQNHPEEARPELAAATKLAPGPGGPALKARAWRALAQIDRETATNGDTSTASDDLLEALKLSPETEEDTLLAASLAEQAHQTDQAEAAYRRLLKKDPTSTQGNAGLAHLLMAKKQFPEAETLLRAALDKTPDSPALSAQLAAVLAAQDKQEALPLLQKLQTANPKDLAITRMLAEVLAESGDFPASDRLYAQLLAAQPANPDILVAHGQNLVRLGLFPQAFAAFEKATTTDPASSDGWSGLAFAASRIDRPDVTIHALTVRSKFLPESASTYFLWATAYDTLHDKPQAIAYYHHFLDAAAGKYPNQEWQAKQRLQALAK